MTITIRAVTATIGAGLLGAIFASQASAGCNLPEQGATPPPWQQQHSGLGLGQAQFIRTAFVQTSEEDFGDAKIVGLWKFTFTAKGNTTVPDGAPIDKGYVQWHGDGTELLNSFRAPTTGQFCMGVWMQVGPSKYKLNHFALGWNYDPSAPVTGPGTGGATFAGTTNIREEIILGSSGNSYTGQFTLTSYSPDGTTVIAPTPIVGIVKATRVTVESTEDDAGITDP